ncbi:MAG: DmsE family decaheme c-type cytochrome [Thermoanaerobaculia bacterium]
MKSSRAAVLAALAVAVFLAVPGKAQEATPAPAPEATYVGADTCAACHDDKEATLQGTPHGQAGFARLSPHACEACHGPGSLHAEDPDNEALRPSFAKLTPAQRSATCTGCHVGGEQFLWQGSAHARQNVACTDCHSVHAPASESSQLRKTGETEQCLTCHKDVRADLWKNSHHPVREGRMSCADCHNPHGGQGPKMLKAVSVNEQCYECHTEKRGPFLWEHAPVRESCTNCHAPHGSNHLKLQKTSVPYLCQQCHANTRHPGTLYDNNSLADASKASNRIFNRACLDCHAAIHGSNDPSAPYLAH